MASCIILMFTMLDALLPIWTMGASNATKRRRLYIFLAITYIWPAIVSGLLASQDNLGSTGALTFCGIGQTFGFDWALFQATIIGAGALLLIFNITLLSQVFKSSQSTGHDRSIRVYVRLTLIDAFFIAFTAVGLQPNWQARSDESKWAASITDWITCALGAGIQSRDQCPRPTNLLDPTTWQVAVSVAMCFGLIFFLIFAGSEEWKTWLCMNRKNRVAPNSGSGRPNGSTQKEVHPPFVSPRASAASPKQLDVQDV